MIYKKNLFLNILKKIAKHNYRYTKITHSLFLVLVFFTNFRGDGQDLKLKINVAPSYSIIQDYSNTIFIGIDFVVPNLVIPTNTTYYRLFDDKTNPSGKLAFDFELELDLKINENLKISALTGFNQLKYRYKTIVKIEGEPTVNLSDLDSNYGNYQVLYLNFKPLNLSTKLFNNKIEILGGPSFNYLLLEKHSDIVLYYENNYNIDTNETTQRLKKAYFETTSKLNNFLYGANLRLNFKINKRLDFFISNQYYFNSIFDKKEDRFSSFVKPNNQIIHLFQLQTGLSIVLF